jgi:parallel beta helix pectate lyase-like protein
LRNLYLSEQTGAGSGGFGISVRQAGVLQIESCVIDGFNEGIDFSVSSGVQVSIKDTVVRNSAASGMAFFASSGSIKASIDHCLFDNNGSAGLRWPHYRSGRQSHRA